MSSGVTASAKDESPALHMNGAMSNTTLSTDISPTTSAPSDDQEASISESISPTSTSSQSVQGVSRISTAKHRSTSTSHATLKSSTQLNGIKRSQRSASANPRDFSRTTAPRKTLEPPSTASSSRLQSKPSFQDIIKRFNDQNDESLPLPKPRSASISSSRCASPTPIRSKSSLATHAPSKSASAIKLASIVKPASSTTRSTVKTSSKPSLNTSKTGRDRRNSGSSTSSQQRGRKTATRSATDPSVRSATPADSIGTAPSDTESKPTGPKPTKAKSLTLTTAARDSSTPPVSPISPTEIKKRPRPSSISTSRTTTSSTTTPGSRSSLPKPINTRTSSNGKTGPLKSPSLNAYIKAPESQQKSPALRSSRPRLPVGAVKNAPQTRSGMTESSSTSGKMNGRATRPAASAAKDDKPKKKIPELGTIDFAARRKMIASAFNDRMEKEREERNRAHQKKEREAAVKRKQQEAEAKKAAVAVAARLDEDNISPTSQPPIGLGLDFGDSVTTSESNEVIEQAELNEFISDSHAAEFVDTSLINVQNYQITQTTPAPENENSTQIPVPGLPERPFSAGRPSPRSPRVLGKPESYKRLSAASLSAPHDGSTTSSRPSSRQMFTEVDDQSAIATLVASPPIVEVHVSHEATSSSESPRVHPKLLIPGHRSPEPSGPDAFHDELLFRRSLSPIQGSPSARSDGWEKAVEDEKRRRKEIEQDRELKLKNRLSTPVTPKNGSPLLENDTTPRGYSHKKQSSWSASPHLAPPDSLGQIMWKYRPLSTSGESMIDTFYKEQEELSLARRRKQELMRFVEPESPAEYEEPTDSKGKALNRYELHDKEYTLDAEPEGNEGGGYVHIEGTYRYSASTVNSSVRSRSVDPNDYWTPQPSIGEFEGNPPRESWATDSTMTSYSTSSGLAPNGSFNRKIMDRERPINADTPPTPPPKDFVFSPKHASSIKSVASDAMPPPPPKTIASRRASSSSENVEPLRISKPPVLPHQEVYESPISINSANSLHPATQDDAPEGSDHSPSSEYSDEAPSDRSSQTRESATLVYPETSPNTSVITNTGSFVSTQEPQALDAQAVEKKMLTKRRFLLRELIDTEKTFFQDMTVTEEIYKGTADACDDLRPEDIRVLFGNTHAIVAFSRGFLDSLKAAAAAVYVPSKQPKTPSGSQIDVNDGNNEPEAEVSQEADSQTWVGEAFAQALPNLERVFGDYCKNHEAAVSKLQTLEKVRGIAIWLKECKVVADDLTHAWSLESLLIKPVQRLLKYPLLLDQILDCTPVGHPDREAIELVKKEVRIITERINESKKRKDMMDKLVGPRRKGDNDLRHGLTKGWQRRAEKLRQTVGLSTDLPADTRYTTAVEKFHIQAAKLKPLMDKIDEYSNAATVNMDALCAMALRFEEFASCSPTRFKEYEERWQTLTKRTKEMKEVALLDHRIRIKRHVITPIETIQKLCENTNKVMQKREKKLVDYARYQAMKEKGDKIDKKTKDLADAYITINDTLLDELPKLHTMVENLLDAVLANFAELCCVWDKYLASRLEGLLDPLDIPSNFSDIIEVYKSDFNKVESVVESLTITNTNANMWKTYSIYSQGSSSSNPETSSLSSHSLYRSPTADGATPSPNPSNFGRSSLGGNSSSHRHSGSYSPGSALVAASLGHALPILPGAVASVQAAQRGRAASAFNIPPTRAPPPPPIRALSSASVPAQTHSPGLSPTYSTHSVAPSVASAPQTHTLNAFHTVDGGSPNPSRPTTADATTTPITGRMVKGHPVLWLCASIYAYHASKEADAKRDSGFPYLTYDQGEIFDVIGAKGEYWLARNQDDKGQDFGWIWSKHFARLALD
ncbi:hypothetical protein TWF970_001478 [Orbilia oligospora]|uniref:Dynamin-binding protein n=1 Tax=Orbilia oligospora TaxID=2813651 RepID=A0A7C8RGX6_ORBOL|nr:hypothetical protein TWF970_001478 [Orbilia oligospora]